MKWFITFEVKISQEKKRKEKKRKEKKRKEKKSNDNILTFQG
jgi:hypothetical protein